MGQKSYQVDAFSFSVAFEFGNQRQRTYRIEVQIEDDQRRLRLRLLEDCVRVLDELKIQARTLGGVREFDGEKQIAHNGQDSFGFLIRHIKYTALIATYAAYLGGRSYMAGRNDSSIEE